MSSVTFVPRKQWSDGRWKWRGVPAPAPAPRLALHHTVTPDEGARTVRAIERDHRVARGWRAGGYSAAISLTKRRLYEMRGEGRQTAAATGHNRGYVHLAILGNNPDLSPDDIEAIGDAVAQLHLAGWGPAEVTDLHRHLGQTTCPGDNIARSVPEINAAVGRALARRRGDPDAEPDRGMPTMLMFARRGTLDYDAASWALAAAGTAGALTANADEAERQRGAGSPLVVIGGPTVQDVLGRDARQVGIHEPADNVWTIVGEDAIETGKKLITWLREHG